MAQGGRGFVKESRDIFPKFLETLNRPKSGEDIHSILSFYENITKVSWSENKVVFVDVFKCFLSNSFHRF
jgi:hypothetical protein